MTCGRPALSAAKGHDMMSDNIEYYYGTKGPTITSIKDAQELYNALDVMHTLVLESNEDSPLARILEAVIEKVLGDYPEVEQ